MNPPETTATGKEYENTIKGQDFLSARAVLHEIRGDLYQYICTPSGRESIKSRFHEKFSLLQSLTEPYFHASQEQNEKDTGEDLYRLLTLYEDLVYDALQDIDTGKEHDIITSLHNGEIHQNTLKIDAFLSAGIHSPGGGRPAGETDALQAQVTALFTIIEIIGAIAVLFPGVFVSIGVPATLAKSITMLNQVQKVYPGVQLALDRKNEITILVGTMAAFAGGMHKNASLLLQQLAADENVHQITVVDETGKTIPVSELVQYALDIQNGQNEMPEEGLGDTPAECKKEQPPGIKKDPDMFQKITRLMDTITNPVGESLKAADQYAHQSIQARMEDVSRGKEFVLQVPLTLSSVGVRIGTDVSTKIRELSEKVSAIKEKGEAESEEK